MASHHSTKVTTLMPKKDESTSNSSKRPPPTDEDEQDGTSNDTGRRSKRKRAKVRNLKTYRCRSILTITYFRLSKFRFVETPQLSTYFNYLLPPPPPSKKKPSVSMSFLFLWFRPVPEAILHQPLGLLICSKDTGIQTTPSSASLGSYLPSTTLLPLHSLCTIISSRTTTSVHSLTPL